MVSGHWREECLFGILCFMHIEIACKCLFNMHKIKELRLYMVLIFSNASASFFLSFIKGSKLIRSALRNWIGWLSL